MKSERKNVFPPLADSRVREEFPKTLPPGPGLPGVYQGFLLRLFGHVVALQLPWTVHRASETAQERSKTLQDVVLGALNGTKTAPKWHQKLVEKDQRLMNDLS